MKSKSYHKKRFRFRYLQSGRRHYEKHITLKEESLYKPLLVTFLIFLLVMVIVFPNSIFDNLAPSVMVFLRRLIYWLGLSSIATLLILPVSVYDIELIRIFADASSYTLLFVVFAIAFAVFADTLFAFLGYRFTKQLSKLFARKVKKTDVDKSNERLKRYGNIGMFFFACTPLPFTLAIYTAGAVRLPKTGFLIAVASGRLVKYSAFAFFLRVFNINLVDFFKDLLAFFVA